MAELPQAVRGFGVTFATIFKKVVTEQYPEQAAKFPPKPRYHGRHQLNRWADGLEKCIGCELCAWACPADAIFVQGADNQEGDRHSPGERYGRVYQINYLRCIFCGLCEEACPKEAIFLTDRIVTTEFERDEFIYAKDKLVEAIDDRIDITKRQFTGKRTDK